MTKTIKVVLTITTEGKKLSTNMDMDNVETLADVVTVGHALEISGDITRGQLLNFLERNGDLPQNEWLTIPASDVLLQES